MKGWAACLLLAALDVALVPGPPKGPASCPTEEVQALLVPHGVALGPIDSALDRFYDARSYCLAWSDSAGPRPRSHALLDALGRAADHGLPDDYARDTISRLLRAAEVRRDSGLAPDRAAASLLDIALSRAFLLYASDLATGRVRGLAVDSLWNAGRRRAPDLVGALRAALASGRVAAALEHLAPSAAGYARLRRALTRYRTGAAWPRVAPGPPIGLGDSGTTVAVLQARLVAEGDLAPGGAAVGVFDSATAQAVRRFQGRVGLPIDGVVGPATRGSLNIPRSERVRAIVVNLERWRWRERMPARYIEVNIPAFALVLYDSGGPALAMRAIVGRQDWPTPITTASLTGILVNPPWNVPPSIAAADLVPRERVHPGTMTREGIRVFRTNDGRSVDPDSINWFGVAADSLYRLVQAPGAWNPLGRIRFVLRDPFDVAIHDTPERELFGSEVRLFSHGCVRIERAKDLAYALLARSGTGTSTFDDALATGATRLVPLAYPVPVFLSYWTAWVDDDGAVEFRRDVYGWDDKLAAALGRGF